jgi:hypothetical protein
LIAGAHRDIDSIATTVWSIMAFAQRRAGRSLAIIVAGCLALAAFSLLMARPGDAAATWVVTFSGTGASPTDITASKGDVIVFKNNLPLAPLTGLLVPVNVNYGGEQFSLGGMPVARTITKSTSFTASYGVLGLIPLSTSSGSVTVTKAAAAPAPPPVPAAPPGSGGTVTPPAATGTPSQPAGGHPAATTHQVPSVPRVPSGLKVPAGDPGTTPGTGTGAATTPPTTTTTTTPSTGSTAGSVPNQMDQQSVVIAGREPNGQPASAAGRHSLVSDSSPSGAFGLAALAGVVLLLGVGTALVRTMLTGRGSAAPAAA